MQAVAEQLEQRSDHELSPVLRSVEHRNDISSLRQQIGIIADDSYRSNYMSEVSYRWHKDVTRPDNTDPRVTTELLEGVKGFAQKQKNYGRVIHSHLQKAARDRVASEGDVKFLLEAFAHHPDFVSKFAQAEKDILGKIERMKDDRKAYDELANHPLVKNTGFLKTDPNAKIDIPDEKAFLKLTVPERRELLEKAKKAFPDAEKYAELHESAEAQTLIKEYESILNGAEKKGILGQKSIEKYMNGFKHIDLEEKKNWIKEMKNGQQLERYVELWKNIRKTLKEGKGLERMETLRNTMGYSELLQAFGEEKEFESQRNCFAYKNKLDTALRQKLISRHTHRDFLGEMRRQSIESQQDYLSKFDNEMERYQTLRGNIDGMKNKEARSVLNEMYESVDCGYNEINAKYERLKSQEGSSLRSATKNSQAENMLSQIQDNTIKKALRDAKEALSGGEIRRFSETIKRWATGKQSSQEDSYTYQKNIKRARREMSRQGDKPSDPSSDESAETTGERETDHISNDARKMNRPEKKHPLSPSASLRTGSVEGKKGNAPSEKVKTNEDGSFQQSTLSNKDDEKRVLRVGIGSKEAVRRLINERNLNHEKDHLSLMAKEGNRIVELKLNEVRKAGEYLRLVANDDEEISKTA